MAAALTELQVSSVLPEAFSCRVQCGHQDTDCKKQFCILYVHFIKTLYTLEMPLIRTKVKNKVTCFLSQDEELHRMCNESTKMQAAYGHYFDLTIINDNLDETYRTVKAALETVSKNPQWVPVTWVF